jgi:hypothetical protein
MASLAFGGEMITNDLWRSYRGATKLNEYLGAREKPSVWLDDRSLRAGDPIAAEIHRVLGRTAAMVSVISPSYLKQPLVHSRRVGAFLAQARRRCASNHSGTEGAAAQWRATIWRRWRPARAINSGGLSFMHPCCAAGSGSPLKRRGRANLLID